MKKKILSLFVGVLGLAVITYAQPSINNVYINGTLASNFAAGGPIPMNSVITYNNQNFYIVLIPAPLGTVQPTSTGITNTLAFGVNSNPFYVAAGTIPGGTDYTPGPGLNGLFGTTDGYFTVTQFAPFDFGISAVLGAGAIAGIKAARRRRKEQQEQATA